MPINPNTLTPHPNNPRRITPEQLAHLVQSIQRDPEYMVTRPIVVTPQRVILAGNQRWRAILQIGMSAIPENWVKTVDWSEEKARRFVLIDNHQSGEWDADILLKSWSDINIAELGIILPVELPKPELPRLTDPDEVPEVVAPVARRGDVWVCGRHRVMCGDSTSVGDVGRLMEGKTAALCHADPPYGMGKEKDGVQNDNLYAEKLDAFQMQWWKAFRAHLDDNGSAYIWGNAEGLWRLWYCGGLKDSERLTLRNAIVWNRGPSAGPGGSGIGSAGQRSYVPATEYVLFFMLGEQGFNTNADNYWDGWEPIRSYLDGERKKAGLTTEQCNKICGKQNMTQAAFTRGGFRLILREDYEKLQTASKGDAFKRDYDAFKRDYDDLKRDYDDLKRDYDDLKREFYATRAYFNNTHDNMTDVWEFPRVTGAERHGHATPKPVAMIERIMLSSLPENGLCVEPFLGSGTTLIAAEKTNRTCYGMEISPAYCDIVIKRWENFTGQTAHKQE